MTHQKMATVRSQWEQYHRQVMPEVDPGSVQFRETKSAFYAAIFSFLFELSKTADESVPEIEGAKMIQAVQQEVTEWIASDIDDRLERVKMKVNA